MGMKDTPNNTPIIKYEVFLRSLTFADDITQPSMSKQSSLITVKPYRRALPFFLHCSFRTNDSVQEQAYLILNFPTISNNPWGNEGLFTRRIKFW